MSFLEGQVAVVTGAASGIGLAIAQQFAAAGAKLMLADVVEDELARVASELRERGCSAEACPTDVRDGAALEALAEATLRKYGKVNVLVNNAGTVAFGPAWQVSVADYERVLGVNLWGVIHGMRAFVPRMLTLSEPCHVVNVASQAGLVTMGMIAPYIASKHAVIALSEVLRHDLAAFASKIEVHVLCPGYVPSRLGMPDRKLTVPPPRAGQPAADDVARALLAGMARGDFYIFSHEGTDELVHSRVAGVVGRKAPFNMPPPSL